MLHDHFFCFISFSFLNINIKNTIKNNFKKHCKCIAHGNWCENGNDQALKIDAIKKFKKSIINELKSKNILSFRGNILCYLKLNNKKN